jgi:hypothetical protein
MEADLNQSFPLERLAKTASNPSLERTNTNRQGCLLKQDGASDAAEASSRTASSVISTGSSDLNERLLFRASVTCTGFPPLRKSGAAGVHPPERRDRHPR